MTFLDLIRPEMVKLQFYLDSNVCLAGFLNESKQILKRSAASIRGVSASAESTGLTHGQGAAGLVLDEGKQRTESIYPKLRRDSHSPLPPETSRSLISPLQPPVRSSCRGTWGVTGTLEHSSSPSVKLIQTRSQSIIKKLLVYRKLVVSPIIATGGAEASHSTTQGEVQAEVGMPSAVTKVITHTGGEVTDQERSVERHTSTRSELSLNHQILIVLGLKPNMTRINSKRNTSFSASRSGSVSSEIMKQQPKMLVTQARAPSAQSTHSSRMVTSFVTVTPEAVAPAQSGSVCLQTKSFKNQLDSRNLFLPSVIHSVCYRRQLAVPVLLHNNKMQQLMVRTVPASRASAAIEPRQSMAQVCKKKELGCLNQGNLTALWGDNSKSNTCRWILYRGKVNQNTQCLNKFIFWI